MDALQKIGPLVALLLLVASCAKGPTADKLAGTYILDKQTADEKLTSFKDTKGEVIIPQLTLHEDGTYEAWNMPVFETLNNDPMWLGMVIDTGKWEIQATESGESGWEILLHDVPPSLKTATLLHEKPPYELKYTYGAPSKGRMLIFKTEAPS